MLILLHDSHGGKLLVNTEAILLVKEQYSSYSYTGIYELHLDGGVIITIKESPQEIERLQLVSGPITAANKTITEKA